MQNNSKNLLFLFKNKEKLANISDTSRDHEFKVSNLNDFTSECIRKEKSDFEEIESLAVSGVCPSRHGGLLDYPKLVTESSGLVTSKWELCINILFPKIFQLVYLGRRYLSGPKLLCVPRHLQYKQN